MPVVTPDKLVSLQRQPDQIRNVCGKAIDTIGPHSADGTVDLHFGSRRESNDYHDVGYMLIKVGPWQDVPHGLAHCHERHHLT